MKTLSRSFYLLLIVLGMAGLSSCEKNPAASGKGEAAFSVALPDQTLKSAMTDSNEVRSYHLLISVTDENGAEVLTDELVPLYQFGNGFISEKVKLETGRYLLTKFMVLDPSGKVIFATPKKGSPKAYLVKKPLPIPFAIHEEKLTTVVPEVLPVGHSNPGEFGYVNFGLTVVRPLHFFTICYLDNPVIMAPTRPVDARLTIYGEDGWHYTFHLRPKVNHLVIRGGSEVYIFVLEKQGYETQRLKFTALELEVTTPREPLVLTIPWGGQQYKKLVLQPGPEKGKDAMITDLDPEKNFGDHKYFETTYLPDSLLDCMRTTRSLLWFDLNDLPKSAVIHKVILRLFYDRPVPWDSTAYITDTAQVTPSCPWYGGVLQRITEPWDEHKVTWKNCPKTSTADQVYISPFRPFVSNTNFINVDVTPLFMPTDSCDCGPNHGMLFRLWPEEKFPGFRFASSDYPVKSMRPELIILYTLDH
jgi:hypothetical protein